MADRSPANTIRLGAVLPLLAALLGLAACARPTGDFGRAKPSVVHDRLLPSIGADFARRRGEPVSDFNLTDDEKELRRRAWAFVRSPHVRDWWLDTLVEGERTRILPALEGEGAPTPEIVASLPRFALPLLDPAYDPRRYYAFLREDRFRSSETRWVRIGEDMLGDALLIPPYCEIAARVRRTDVERLAALNRQPGIDPATVDHAYARVSENEAVNAWVWRALRYRLTAYRFAIDSLEIETPSDRLWETNRTFQTLAGTRCEGAPAIRLVDQRRVPRPSRYAHAPDPFDEPVLQK
jgi:hypothetical protein